MTATQSFKIYEILHNHFKSDAGAKAVEDELKTIIENKLKKEKNQLSTQKHIYRLNQKNTLNAGQY